MTKRRSRGDGGLHWDDKRQRWIATASLGYGANGKRITRRASGRTKTEAREKLWEMFRDHDDGLTTASGGYTVGDALRDWLAFGQGKRDKETVAWITSLALGARRLRELSADDVDRWLAEKSRVLGTRSLQAIHSILGGPLRVLRHGTR